MTVTTNISLDLLRPSVYPKVNAVKDDVCTRDVLISLYSGGVSWLVPEGVSAAVGYRKPDGTVGLYDTLPDGSSAVSISGNSVTLTLAAQMLTAVGSVDVSVTLLDESRNQISTFPFNVIVAPNPGSGATMSQDYFNYVNPMIQAVIENAAAATAAANAAAEKANASSGVAYEALGTAKAADQKVDTLREVVSKFHSNIVEEAEGEFITVSDASDLELAGLKIFGKTVQNGTPTPDAPAALESIGDSGSVTVTACGKNLISDNWVQGMLSTTDGKTISANDYWVTNSDYIPVSSNLAYSFSADSPNRSQIFFYDVNKEFLSSRAPLADSSTSVVTISDNVKYVRFAYNYSGATETITPEQMGVTHYLQLELGSTATAYEPYTATTATVSTPNGLPGIPVESGGNYADSTGQQWICDEVDFEKGVYVQRVGKLILTGEETLHTWSGAATGYYAITVSKTYAMEYTNVLCNRASVAPSSGALWLGTSDNGIEITVGTSSLNNIRFRMSAYTTVSDMQAQLAQWYNDGDPMAVQYILATENPIPLTDIDPDALTAYATMHTNYPNTTVFNDAGAHMKVNYVADTKLYVDKQFNKLAAQLVNNV